ncbi:hypothetical protein CYJ36_19760 [Bacillus sp. UMB0893]|nr:hypothetical protein CYJ36_19760 [Bacillus sp. UMB0893]
MYVFYYISKILNSQENDFASSITHIGRVEQKANDQWTAKINNPKSSKYVSLRATALDDQGNKISQEVIKAYGLR